MPVARIIDKKEITRGDSAGKRRVFIQEKGSPPICPHAVDVPELI
jgi:hypothetical protein